MFKKNLRAFSVVATVALLLSFSVQAASLSWTPLTLLGGWLSYEAGTRLPAGAIDPNNIVHLRGAIYAETGQSNRRAFRLPAELRPAGDVYVPVDTCEANYGRLYIEKTGNVYVHGITSALECFVSLEGVSFPKDGAGVGSPT